MKKRNVCRLLAVVVLVGLAVNAASHNDGWVLVGEIFGWALIIGGLFAIIDNKLKAED